MEEPLSNEVVIDTDSLKFFISKLKVWDYAKVSAADYQKLSFDYRSSILKKYLIHLQNIQLVQVKFYFLFQLEVFWPDISCSSC